MFCKYCGKPIDDDSIYCRHCGAKIANDNKIEKQLVAEYLGLDMVSIVDARTHEPVFDEVARIRRKAMVDGKLWAICRCAGLYGVIYGDSVIVPFEYNDIFLASNITGKLGSGASALICSKDGEKCLLSPVSATEFAPLGLFDSLNYYSVPEEGYIGLSGVYKEWHEEIGEWQKDFWPDNKTWYELPASVE